MSLRRKHRRWYRVSRWALLPVFIALAVVLVQTVLSTAPANGELPRLVDEEMSASGVLHPLTAVLLNFRGYDTLLEIGVLLVAVIAVWSLDASGKSGHLRLRLPSPNNAALRVDLSIILPLMVLMAGYMVWIGSYRPGGAFQSGAILGAAAVTLISSGMLPAPFGRSRRTRLALAGGFSFFMTVAILTVLFKGRLLNYPMAWAGTMILLIETLLAVSIGAALAALFAGVAGIKVDEPGSPSRREERGP
ncbi:MAG TPA: MnhB domain-containing protein [Kiritimatiellia bacterium]|nr:MnhB domain-containing protein [Kiritimatiellia bacterium]HMO99270.1 MnhB domain-containing protein [Kiritimatiellia bacterium]HMP97695.1 MnhB domain-containing protein [Kiritimatiellia bacterium]